MSSSSSSSPTSLQINSTGVSPLKALLEQSIDYAGLFPPAELDLETALENHREYVASTDAWMLSTFVLPAARFFAAAPLLSRFNAEKPLRISALGPKSADAAEFRQAIAAAAEAIRGLQSQNLSGISVVQLEIAIPNDCDLALLAALNEATAELGLRVFCEAPAADAERVIALLAQNNTTEYAPLGYKLRTGGVTADTFPRAGEIARALVAAYRDTVPIKFTAGLHHPVRQFRTEVNGKMYGFLNVLGAGVLAAEHAWDEATTAQMLEDENADSFVFDGESFAWREWKISAEAIRRHRELITSFGSCSFDEPRDDLRALRLL